MPESLSHHYLLAGGPAADTAVTRPPEPRSAAAKRPGAGRHHQSAETAVPGGRNLAPKHSLDDPQSFRESHNTLTFYRETPSTADKARTRPVGSSSSLPARTRPASPSPPARPPLPSNPPPAAGQTVPAPGPPAGHRAGPPARPAPLSRPLPAALGARPSAAADQLLLGDSPAPDGRLGAGVSPRRTPPPSPRSEGSSRGPTPGPRPASSSGTAREPHTHHREGASWGSWGRRVA